jgi:predicted RNA methylase
MDHFWLTGSPAHRHDFSIAARTNLPEAQPAMSDVKMAAHWNEKITWWADSSYEEKPRGPLERWMAKLRRSVHARAVIALDLLRPHLAGKVLVDVGCGNGHFAKECVAAGAKHVYGIDIAPQAVELAKQLAHKNGVGPQTTFLVGKAGDPTLPEADFVTGFGLIDWLTEEECLTFFRKLSDRRFVFSFSEADGSFDEWVHYFYLIKRLEWFGDGVLAHHHKRAEILGRLKTAGIQGANVVSDHSMRFGRLVHNLK